MTLSLRSRQAEADSELPMRSPEQLALALPLLAVIGVMIVVAAVATGGSAHFVAIAAVGGFALCAVAPMALLDAFVGRPLRAALDQLRAARDGQPAPRGRPFAFGLIGDLVQLAADIRSTQSTALALAQSPPFVELAEAIKGLRAAPPGAFDGAVERIETMLVYIAETLERRETQGNRADEAFGRVERGFTDMARLLSRETEALQGSVSSATLMVRNEIVSTAAEDMAARTRVLERLDSFEARVLSRLADSAPPDLSPFAELIRNEADSTRRALRERTEKRVCEADGRRLDEVAAHLALLGNRFVDVADQVSQRIAAVDRIADETLPAAQGALREATQRLEGAAVILEARVPEGVRSLDEAMATIGQDVGQRIAAAEARLVERIGGAEAARFAGASPAPAALEELRADLRVLADAVGDVVARAGAEIAARTQAAAQTQAERVLEGIAASRERAPAPSADLDARIEALAGAVAALGVRLADTGAGFDRREIDHILQSLIAATQTMAKTSARLDGAAGGPVDLADLRTDLRAFGERLERQTEAQATRLDAIESRVVEQVIGIERDQSATTLTALLKTTKDLRVAIDRLDALSARSAPEGGLKSEVRGVGEAVAALAKRLDRAMASAGAPLVGGATERSVLLAEGRLEDALAGIGARLEALNGAAAKTADLAALRVEIADVGAQAGRAVAEMATHVETAVRSEADRVVGRIDALDTGEWTQAQARLDGVAARIDAGAELLAARAATDLAHFAAISEGVGKAAADVCHAVETQADRLAARLDAGASEVAGGFAQTQARLDACAAGIEAAAAAMADVAGRNGAEGPVLRADLAKVADDVSRVVADLAARVEAGSQAQADRVVERLAALRDGTLDHAREALAETEARWSGQASRFEAAVSALSVLAATGALDFAALRDEVTGVGQVVASAAADASARIETSAQALGRDVAEGLAALGGIARGLVEASGKWDQLAVRIEALAAAEGPNLADLGQAVGETASRAVEAVASRFDEASRAHSARLLERFAELDRGVVNAMFQAFDAITKDLADTRARLDRSAEAAASATIRDGEAFAALQAQIAGTAEAVLARAERLDQRLAALASGDFAPSVAALSTNVAAALAALQTRAESLSREAAEGFSSLGARVEEIAVARRDEVSAGLGALRALTMEIGESRQRIDQAASALERGADALSRPGVDFGALARNVANSVAAELADHSRAQAERLAALEARVLAEIAAHDNGEATRAITQTAGALAAVSSALEARNIEAGIAEREAVGEIARRFDAFAEELARRAESLRVVPADAIDRGAAASALGEFRAMTKELADAKARLDAAAAHFEARAEALGASPGSGGADESQLKSLGETVAGLAAEIGARFDAFAETRPDRAAAADLELEGRAVALDRGAVASALGEFQAMTRSLAEAVARFEAATAAAESRGGAPDEARADFDDLRRELAAVGEQVSGAVQRLDGRLDVLAAAQAGRLEALEGRLGARPADASSLAVVRAITGDPSPEGAAVDGAGVASALAAFRAMTRTLQEATERFETATAAVQARSLPADLDGRLDLLARGQAEGFAGLAQSLDARTQGLASMKQQLAAALTRLEETASTLDRGARPEVVVTQLDTALLTELRSDLREVGAKVAEALAGFAAKLENSVAVSAGQGADWRQDIASLADLIADLERRLTTEPSAAVIAPPSRTPAAVAKIVVSLADSLDFRFAEIETGLAELCSRLPAFDASADLAAAGLASLVGQISAASEVLKAGLSEFAGVSAALVEDLGATDAVDRQPEAAVG